MTAPLSTLRKIVDRMWNYRYDVDPNSLEGIRYDPGMQDDPTYRHMGPVVVDLGDLAELRAAVCEIRETHRDTFVVGSMHGSSFAGWWVDTATEEQRRCEAEKEWEKRQAISGVTT